MKKWRLTKDERRIRVIGLIIMAITYTAAMKVIGYIIATMLFVIICTYCLGYKRHLNILLISVVFTIVVYKVFRDLLYVPLEPGLLFFLR